MDPKVTLELAREAFNKGDLSACTEHLRDYTAWRAAGGFEPQDGADKEACKLVERLAYIEMERDAMKVAALDDLTDDEDPDEEGE